MNLRIVLACMILGVVTEALSQWQKLWIYQYSWWPIVSVLVVFGLLFGWLSTMVADYSPFLRFVLGAVVGVAYEGANLWLLHIWHFPNQRLLFLRGRVALALGAGIPWGIAPLVTPLFR